MKFLPTAVTVSGMLWASAVLSPTKEWWHAARTLVSFSPRPSLEWTMPTQDPVTMRIIHFSDHYAVGSTAWSYLLPPSGHVVHIDNPDGSGISTHTPRMFHQLRCIQLLHEAYINEGSHRTSPYASHCMNYFRQTALCLSDMSNGPQGTKHDYTGYDYMCRDWEVAFQEADRNAKAYSKLLVEK